VSRLFDDWAASLARGEQPDPQEYLERAGGEAAELERMMDAFLVAAPRREPDADAVAAMRAWADYESPLAALRAARGVRRDDVVDAVMERFALPAEKRGIVKRYVHRLEAGLIDPRRLSAPLAALLEQTLHVSAATLRGLRVRPIQAAPAFRARPAMVLGDATREQEEDDEEVRALFLSGR
jgi:hypothetical protein